MERRATGSGALEETYRKGTADLPQFHPISSKTSGFQGSSIPLKGGAGRSKPSAGKGFHSGYAQGTISGKGASGAPAVKAYPNHSRPVRSHALNTAKCALGMLLLLTLFAAPLDAKVGDAAAARDKAVADLLGGETAGHRVLHHPELLPAGASIETWHRTALVTPKAGYVVFIDDMPYANFCHPCRFVFVDEGSGEVEVFASITPPSDVEEWVETDTKALRDLMAAKNRMAPRKEQPAAPQRSARGGELYAVLMNGGASQWSGDRLCCRRNCVG